MERGHITSSHRISDSDAFVSSELNTNEGSQHSLSLFDNTAKDHPIVYDGFEPSGRMHIAQGVLRAINVNKLTSTGCVFKFWVADWFAQLNNKMDGDLNKIKTVGLYMIEIWKAIGMNMQNVQFLWASDEINAHAEEYWTRVMDIARYSTIYCVLFYVCSEINVLNERLCLW